MKFTPSLAFVPVLLIPKLALASALPTRVAAPAPTYDPHAACIYDNALYTEGSLIKVPTGQVLACEPVDVFANDKPGVLTWQPDPDGSSVPNSHGARP